MLSDLWTVLIAVIFVSVNGMTMLAWAAQQGYKMKPTAFAYIIGAVGNLVTGSITPIAGQSSVLTVSHFMKNMNDRVGALLIAVVGMTILGLTGGVTWIAAFAGQPVIWGMMAGVGIMLAGICFNMVDQAKRTGVISVISALITFAIFLGNPNQLVYVIAVSVTLSVVDFAIVQGKRVDILQAATEGGYTGDMNQNTSWKFWAKENREDFTIIKPKFGLKAIYFALAFICINIGTNISFAGINTGMTGGAAAQNLDHLTIINGIADIPSVIFGGAPVGAIISATAASPWPVAAGVIMMAFCAVLLLFGLMTKAFKYVPVQSLAGFLLIIGLFSTFVPNLRNVFMFNGGAPGDMAIVQAAFAMALTALTKNPFIGMVGGIAVYYIGHLFFMFL